jgi:hypothetical protein
MKKRSKKGFLTVLALTMFTYVSQASVLLKTADVAISDEATPMPVNAVFAMTIGGFDFISGSCTMFAASFGDTVLYGNNEDYIRTMTYYWVRLPGEDTYGGVYLGHYSEEEIQSRGLDRIYAQGGVNEKGLAFDYAALPQAALTPRPDLPPKQDIMMRIQECCTTVEEAIAMGKKYDWGTSLRCQVLLADAAGDAVVISAGRDGELAFTRKAPGDGYLLNTNFNRADSEKPYRGGYPCWRYDKADEMLKKIRSEEDLTVKYFQSILDAVHVEGPLENTEYSNVFDLRNGVIYLNHWHQFDETAAINIAEEIARQSELSRRGRGTGDQPMPLRIKDLFSPETVKKAEQEHQKYKDKINRRRS